VPLNYCEPTNQQACDTQDFSNCCVVSNSHAGFGPFCVALADHALTLMETIMADLKLESLSPTAVSSHLS